MKNQREHLDFERVVLQLKGPIYTLVYRLTGSKNDAEDLSQETSIRAWKSWHQLRDPKNPLPWVRKICLNLFLESKRSQGKVATISLDKLEEEGKSLPALDSSPSPLEQVIVEETVREIQDGCFTTMAAHLPIYQRVTFALVGMFTLKVDQVAALLGRSTSATKALLHRARENMNAFFSHHCSLVLPENTCKCESWREFVEKQRAGRESRDQIEAHIPDFSDPSYASQGDANTLSRVLSLFRNLPPHDPGPDWFKRVSEAVAKKIVP